MEVEELKFVNHGTRIPGMDQFDEFSQDSVTLHGWSPDKEATSGPVGSVYLILMDHAIAGVCSAMCFDGTLNRLLARSKMH
jgi:hypothetical protein